MSHTCLRDEELFDAAASAENARLRREAEACPRCRARLAAFHEFLHPSGVPAGAKPEEADRRLAVAFDTPHRGGRPAGQPTTSPAGATSGPTGAAPRKAETPVSWWRATGGTRGLRGLRLAWAGAAIVVLIWAGHEAGVFEREGGHPILLREDPGGASCVVETHAPVLDAGGAVRLSWSPVAGADRYDVVIHGEDFREILQLDAAGQLSLILPAEQADRLRAGSEIYLWRVAAYSGGDMLAQSPIQPLHLPHAP